MTLKVIVDVPAFPSAIDWSSIEMSGTWSSFVMVPSPEPSAIPALPAPKRLTVNVSSASWVVSPLMVTSTVLVVWPGSNVTVPDAAARSPSATVAVAPLVV